MEHAVVAASLQNINGAGMRLKPEMTSRRLLVLAFVRDYLARWGSSPSYGEIANGLGISPTRARQLVKALVASGQLLRRPGPRGLYLPTLRDEAVRQLRELGYVVDEDIFTVCLPCAHSTLPARPMLDYVPPGFAEVQGGDYNDEPRGKAARAG
jgi:DNA-binding MarR family transcriptional regulator